MSFGERKKQVRFGTKSDSLEERLQALLENLMRKKHIKHAIAAVESGDRSFRWIGAEGDANPDGTPMEADTPFWIASITKLFIAAAIFKLHEQKHISINNPMAEYLPGDLIEGLHRMNDVDYANKITLRHLLGHSSGLPDYIEIRPKGEKSLFDRVLEEGDRAWTIEDVVEVVRRVNTPLFAPQPLDAEKKKIRYSDTNFQLLIAIIENVTGKPIHTVFEELLYKPLGLEETFLPGTSPANPLKPAATVYYQDKPLNIPEAMRSFGDLYSTVNNLFTFMRALVSGEVFDDPDTINLMRGEWNQFGFSISPIGPGWPIEYSLGIMRFRIPRIISPFRPVPEIIGHTGATGSWLFYCPPLDIYLAGDVSQITAGPVPFQFVPKMLGLLNTHFR